MSVNAKMTAIADEIRELNGGTEKLGLDAMAENVREGNNEIALQEELLERAIAELKGKADPELYDKGYAAGYEQGEALLIQGKPSRIENNVVTSIRDSAFYYGSVSTPTYVSFKNAKTIGVSAFKNCRSLQEAYFDSVTSIGKDAFYLCSALRKLVIRTPSVCTLSGALSNSSITSGTGYIYVPDNLVDSYKVATNWSAVASQIKPLSELEV